MGGNAREVTTFADLISGGALEIGDGYRAKNDELGGAGLPFLRAGHVTDTHIDFEGVERFHAALESRIASKVARPGDAVITTKGNSTGRTAFVSSSMPPFVYSPHLSYWRSLDASRLESGFLRFWCRSPEFTAQLSAMKTSTDMAPYLSLADQRRLRITLPSIAHQRAISRVLGGLDDKLDSNRRMNETLEAMARAHFKSWFVDFNPVRAKADGRDPGLPNPVSDLFPSSFQDSEQGEIPKGWRSVPVSDLADVLGGSTPSTSEPSFWNGGDVYWATPRDMAPLTSPVLLETERRITPLGLEQIGPGLLPRGAVLMSSRAPIGYLAIIEVPVAVNQGVIAMVPKPGVPSPFLLWWAERSQEEVVSRANGSTFLEISKGNFRSIPILDPGIALLAAFGGIAVPLHEQNARNERESRTLAALRDTLLPKLVSGELRVPDAERIVGKAV